MRGEMLLVVVCLLLVVPGGVESAKILMAPIDHHSHVNYFALVGGLLKGAGHEVHILSFPRHQKTVDKSGLKPQMFDTKVENILADPEKFMEMTMTHGQSPLTLFNTAAASQVKLCGEMFSNSAFIQQLKAEKFDLLMVDGVDFYRCIFILPHILDVRYVTLTSRHDPWRARVSSNPAVENLVPLFGFSDPSDPSFVDRVKNLAASVAVYVMMPPGVVSDDLIEKYAPGRPRTTFQQLYQRSEMFLVNLETVCLDWPRVGAPHYIYLGGIGLQPPKPLPAEFEEFIKDADDGVIVMTFGSGLKRIPMDKLEMMLNAYQKVTQKVIMRYDGPAPDNVPGNVKLSKWLPQNDLLGHPKTRLFITHGGNNGQMEALYHGVPMVTVPVFGDQFYSGLRAQTHGYGEVVDYRTMTSEALYDAMHAVLSDTSYEERIKSCSRKFHAMPDTASTLTFWVDHVIKHGGAHLKPQHMDMPMWKFLGLDLMLVFGAVFYICLRVVKFVVFKILGFIIRKITGSGREKSKTE